LVAMNPAALKASMKDIKRAGLIIINGSSFTEKNIQKAELDRKTIESLRSKYKIIELDITRLTKLSVEDIPITSAQAERCKNFYALGLVSWMFNLSIDPTIEWIKKKFTKNRAIAEANIRAIESGYNYGETAEMFTEIPAYDLPKARMSPGRYTVITGNQALSYGLIAASKKAGIPLFLGSYPITPASEILQELSRYKHLDVITFQAEDEIAGICSAIGASYSGMIASTSTSGPGFSLKQEALGLAVMAELPLVVLNIQRAGPSTGLPTKTEQGDLLQTMFGRHGEAPVIIIAPQSSADCFYAAFDAVKLAIKYMTPVVVLSDGYLGNGSEPFLIPDVGKLEKIEAKFRIEPDGYFPYSRNPETLARAWVKPGTPGLEHKIGGLEKDALTGCVSHDPENHDKMVRTRANKIQLAIKDVPDVEVLGNNHADVLVVGWGSTFGAISQALEELNNSSIPIAQIHLRYLNPLPKNLGNILTRYKKIIVPEINLGQLAKVLREVYLIDTISFNAVKGTTLRAKEIADFVRNVCKGVNA